MVLPLESLNLGSTVVRKLSDGFVMIASKLVHLLLVGKVSIFELVEPVLLSAGVILLEALDLTPERFVLSDELFLVGTMNIGILVNLYARLGDVHLKLSALVLGVSQEILVDQHVMLQIIYDLHIKV